jgi:serine/threonine-protein kinase
MTQSQAESTITNLGLKVGNATNVNSNEKKGTVVFQSVKEGAEVEAGTKVNIQISEGPANNDNSNQSDQSDENKDSQSDQNDGEKGNDDNDSENSDDDKTTHQIKVTLPDNREKSSAVVIKVNGTTIYTNTAGPDESVVTVSYTGNIDKVEVTVDGVDYSNYKVS